MPGQLFTHYFLTDGIKTTDEWKTSVSQPDTFANFSTGIEDLFEKFARFKDPNEAVTEQDLICPVLELLGWTDYLPQQGTARNEDIPHSPAGRRCNIWKIPHTRPDPGLHERAQRRRY